MFYRTMVCGALLLALSAAARAEEQQGSDTVVVTPGAGGGVWLALRAGGPAFDFASTMSFAVVRSDEGTTFFMSGVFGF